MRRFLLALLLLPGVAAAQLRSGPDAPAASSQLPPSVPPGNSEQGPTGPLFQPDDRPQPGPTGAAQGSGRREPWQNPEVRIAPPPGHQVVPAPAMPGAERPESSEGFFTTRDVIPPHVGDRVRPDAPTTETGQQQRGRGAEGGGTQR